MFQAILVTVAALLSPSPADRATISDLGAKSFRVREAAQERLKERMTYRLAIHLEYSHMPNLESRHRADQLVRAWWAKAYPCFPATPHLDTLTDPRVHGNIPPWMRSRYLETAKTVIGGCHWPHFWEFRKASDLMFWDFRATRLPPEVFRPIIRLMNERSDRYDRGRGYIRPEFFSPDEK